ncbi:MAG: TetR/AcrR family transcriptional regulator [Deltaproteobacteria bacterium]|nr:TetR/AcrR family transcriptional regulator [Deltaproteobacteria bacterium]MBW2414313.1 TetR/AcrR family transcriptional regulator [Deltaproteobacteria bacterium]
MPSPRFRNLDAARQAAILDAASEEFATNEFEDASYNRVIERAGISKGAMYYYFDNKEDLYQTVLQRMFERLAQYVTVDVEVDSAEAYWRRGELVYARMLRFFQMDDSAAGLARGLIRARERGQGDDATERRERGREVTATQLALGQSVGAVRLDLPQNLLVALAMATSQGVYGWMAEHLGALPESELEPVARALVRVYRRLLEPLPAGEEDASVLLKAERHPTS